MKGTLKGLRRLLRRQKQRPKILRLSSFTQPKRGRVLFSYLTDPLLQNDPCYFDGHSNKWKSMEIARLFRCLGFELDAVEWTNQSFVPESGYDVVFDIYINQQRWFCRTSGALQLLHLTGSDWCYQNEAELKRVKNLEARRKVHYMPQRIVPLSSLLNRSLEIADYCSLIGNRHTLSTYSETYHPKFTCITGTASSSYIKNSLNYVPREREFLWFFGGGAVHKGLDIVLEVFARNPHLTLNVVGNYLSEADFTAIYRRELTELPNIKAHGYLMPTDHRFKEIVDRCFCFIAPSCSEGMSPAVATCMQIGLYPVISRDTGISLPEGVGKYLELCNEEEIEEIITSLASARISSIREEIAETQRFASTEYSRERFSKTMREHLRQVLL